MGGQTQNFLPQYGLQSERLLWPTKGPGAFEQEVAALERTLGLTTMGKGLAWVQTSSMWPANFGLFLLHDRDDGRHQLALRHRPLRHGVLPSDAAPVRPDDRSRVAGAGLHVRLSKAGS
jgi:hypothetical protein